MRSDQPAPEPSLPRRTLNQPLCFDSCILIRQVFTLWGAQKLLDAHRIRCIKFELSVEWLTRLNTSAEALYSLLTSQGFGIFATDLVTPVTRTAFLSKRPYPGSSKYPDFVARFQGE